MGEKQEANLGLATTRQLLEELAARMDIHVSTNPELTFSQNVNAVTLSTYCHGSLTAFSEEILSYRTVDS